MGTDDKPIGEQGTLEEESRIKMTAIKEIFSGTMFHNTDPENIHLYYNSPFKVCLSVCRCSQTAGRNSCSIISRDASNCSHRRTVHHVTNSRLSSA